MKKIIITEDEKNRILGLHKHLMVEQPITTPDESQANMATDDLMKPISTKKGVITPGVKNEESVDISKLEGMLKQIPNIGTRIGKDRLALGCYNKIKIGSSRIVLNFTIPRVDGGSSTLIKDQTCWDVFDVVGETAKNNFGNLTLALKQNPNLKLLKSILDLLKTDKYSFDIFVDFWPRIMEADNYELKLFEDCVSDIEVKVKTDNLPEFVKKYDISLTLNPDGTVGYDKKIKYTINNNELIFVSTEQPKTSSPKVTQTSVSKTDSGISSEKINNTHDRAFDYMLKDGKYYFRGKGNYKVKYPNWEEAKGEGLKSIQNNVKF
jgi:hypothetical protein